MPIHILKKVPDLEDYVIGDLTMAMTTTEGATIQFVLIK